MTSARLNQLSGPIWVLATSLGYLLLAFASLKATKGADNIAALWPPSGFFLAMLLLMPDRTRKYSFAGMAVASVLANWLGGSAFLNDLAFTLANMVEAAVAYFLIRRRRAGSLSFMVPRSVGNFCLATLVASLCSGGIATVLVGNGFDFFLSWSTTVALGMLIVAPPIVMLARLFDSGVLDSMSSAMKAEAVAVLTVVAALTAATFAQAQFPLLFLPFVAVVAATYRLGPFGAGAGVLILASISSYLTSNGAGPVAALDGGQKVVILFLQFYLVTILFTALPLAALLVMQQRLTKRLEQSNRWLLQAEAAALVGHWRVDSVRWTIYWSTQTYRIHGREAGSPISVEESLEHYLPEDRDRVNKTLETAFRKGEPFEFVGRIMRADGKICHVKSFGTIEKNRKGRSIGLFGSIQDVTETVQVEQSLQAAREIAETAANTDMLTGLPNRRHTLAFLADAMGRARETNGPLAVAIFDIDHFKQINDFHGHAVGDKVICAVADRSKISLREGDLVGRFGGEEFVCILQGSSAKSATVIAERVRKAIEAHHDADAPQVTVSIGLAFFAGEATVEELLHRADNALYLAKREGRNRLRLAA